jgi:CRISPR-associated protein Csx17
MAEEATQQNFEIELTGCRAEPLASYLKAVAVLRIVAEQKDKNARGFWRGEFFVLHSRLDPDALTRFFVDEWKPSPVVAPWNSGSGFWPSTSDEALRKIETSSEPRLAAYAATISAARKAITLLGLVDAPEKGEQKTRLLTYLRANVSEEALGWLDAAAVLTDDEPIYPALLGTGGNDGRQDFSNNFMQRLLVALEEPQNLLSSIFGVAARAGTRGSMGQFFPASLERSNAWDFILAIEGSLMLAGAATRRLESRHGDTLAFPFHARAASASSLADGEEGHGELWLPRWSTPSTCREVRRLFSEGRAKTSTGGAATGLDFARSVASLGVDRGLSEFIRVSFQARNGKNYFATSLGRFATRDVLAARLLDDIDSWFDRFRQKATGKNAPARVALARRRLEQAMFESTRNGMLGPVLLELGDTERALALSPAFTARAFLAPISKLPANWGSAVADRSVEQRLAAALAARPGMRGRLVPLDKQGRGFGRGDEASCVFTERPLVDNLHALLLREDIEDLQQRRGPADEASQVCCSLTDIAQFIRREVDDVLVERWLRALVLVEGGLDSELSNDAWTIKPPASFAVIALVHHRRLGAALLPRTVGVLTRACAGDAVGATEVAIRRLNACARPLPVRALFEPTIRMRRIAAALTFPLHPKQRRTLESMVLPAVVDDTTNSKATGSAQEPA